MKKSFSKPNSRKKKFLAKISLSDIETSDISTRCKFNFSYFDASQEAGQDFDDWNSPKGASSLITLLNKIKNFTCSSLTYWKNERSGAGGLKVLEVYGTFPKISDFSHPPGVPHDVAWSRFRLGNKVRLIGFVIPENLRHDGLDHNTFYVVFLDKNHVFYKIEKNR